jgi:hypothetical protein
MLIQMRDPLRVYALIALLNKRACCRNKGKQYVTVQIDVMLLAVRVAKVSARADSYNKEASKREFLDVCYLSNVMGQLMIDLRRKEKTCICNWDQLKKTTSVEVYDKATPETEATLRRHFAQVENPARKSGAFQHNTNMVTYFHKDFALLDSFL